MSTRDILFVSVKSSETIRVKYGCYIIKIKKEWLLKWYTKL